MARYRVMTLLASIVTIVAGLASLQAAADSAPLVMYKAQPGDVLHVGVWKEPELTMEVLVRPDGGFSMPLIGEVYAAGRSVAGLREELLTRIGKLVPDTDVVVTVRQLNGNKIYVIGKVARPGEFVVTRNVDVMQALSMAGGTTAFADVNGIKILRRSDEGQRVFDFQYGAVERGQGLEQNIVLTSGDIIVVP